MRLADARKLALERNTWIKSGIDPRTQAPGQRRKQAQNSSRPFTQIAQAWFDHHSASWSPRYYRDMRKKLDHFVIPTLGQLDKVIAATRFTHYQRISWVELQLNGGHRTVRATAAG